MSTLANLGELVVAGNESGVVEAVNAMVADKADPVAIINEGLLSGMNVVGEKFKNGEMFVPEVLMAARAMKGALDLLKPQMKGAASHSLGKVVIGTVKGDLHDIGKNLVASMLEGCGFEVINLGTDISSERFINALKENRAQILCLSALLTTTMNYMQEVIDALEQNGIRSQVKVMIGGAPVSESFARQIGADGYSDNANAAVSLAKSLLSA